MYDTVVFNDEEKPKVSFYIAQQASHKRKSSDIMKHTHKMLLGVILACLSDLGASQCNFW